MRKKTAKPVDLNTKILQQIRDGIVQLESRLGARIDLTNAHLVALGDKIETVDIRINNMHNRLIATETRLATQHVAVLGALERLQATLERNAAADLALESHEQRIAALERKVS